LSVSGLTLRSADLITICKNNDRTTYIELTNENTFIMPNYDVMILNFANPDMVGHTGDMTAAIKAVEAVDTCLEKVVNAILATGGQCIVTADHGNADIMMDKDGKPFTAHTTNPVPMIVVGAGNVKLNEGGRLSDLIPTLLDMMNIDKPAAMTGKSLIIK